MTPHEFRLAWGYIQQATKGNSLVDVMMTGNWIAHGKARLHSLANAEDCVLSLTTEGKPIMYLAVSQIVMIAIASPSNPGSNNG